nr:hypothetical protein [Tanacetum cinerariifolium]
MGMFIGAGEGGRDEGGVVGEWWNGLESRESRVMELGKKNAMGMFVGAGEGGRDEGGVVGEWWNGLESRESRVMKLGRKNGLV